MVADDQAHLLRSMNRDDDTTPQHFLKKLLGLLTTK